TRGGAAGRLVGVRAMPPVTVGTLVGVCVMLVAFAGAVGGGAGAVVGAAAAALACVSVVAARAVASGAVAVLAWVAVGGVASVGAQPMASAMSPRLAARRRRRTEARDYTLLHRLERSEPVMKRRAVLRLVVGGGATLVGGCVAAPAAQPTPALSVLPPPTQATTAIPTAATRVPVPQPTLVPT